MVLPRYIAIRNAENKYLSCIPTSHYKKYELNFNEAEPLKPSVKFEVVPSTHDSGLVHIRNCLYDTYWTQVFTWVVSRAEKKDEDKSNDSCTLFNFIPVDVAAGKFKIIHVNSGNNLCLCWADKKSVSPDGAVLCFHKSDADPCFDVFTVIDWSSFLILPRYVAFKAHNGNYLGENIYSIVGLKGIPIEAHQTDIGAIGVACEIVPTNDGNIRIISMSTKGYWSQDLYNYIATLPFGTIDPKYTVFCPVKVDGNTIALKSVASQLFCNTKDSILQASSPFVENEARITLEEAVLNREISGATYHVDRARIYNQSTINLTEASVRNPYETTRKMSMTLRYNDARSRSWRSSQSLTIGVKASMEFEIPFIGDGGVEVSTEVQRVEEWGKTDETSIELEIQHEVDVPPHTLTTVRLIATRATADVPLSYTQRDTLYDGTVTATENTDAYFTGSNYFNLTFDNIEVPLNNPDPEPLPPKPISFIPMEDGHIKE